MTRRTTTTAALLVVGGVAVLSGCSAAGAAPAPTDTAGIGGWPTFLPTPTPGAQARGDVTDPAMSYAGSPVLVTLPSGTTLTADVQGPSYPPDEGAGADSVPCTFTIELRDASAPVDLSAARFDVVDSETGADHLLQPAGGTAIPGTVEPGRTVTFDLVATVPSGEGFVRFAPDGTRDVAGWDYVAETD
ncbi:MAG TPA: hypothetical protein VGC04_00265 [Cellulomonas sp.]